MTKITEAAADAFGSAFDTKPQVAEREGLEGDENVRAAFAAAEKLPPLPLADNPDDAVMALAAAARTSRKGPEGNAFVLQHIIRVVNSYRAALAPSPNGTEASRGVIPAGWRLVPVEPTKDMLNAIWTYGPFSKAQLTASYNDLLAATPTPPVSPPDSTGQGDNGGAGPSPFPRPWRHCPSTHCERAQECRSPSDCTVRGAGLLRQVQALGAAISRREWSEAETAHANIRDMLS